MNHTSKIGVGLEAEGFFLTAEGHATSVIQTIDETIPTSEFVLSELHRLYPQFIPLVSPELVSVTLEIKSRVYDNFQAPIDEIIAIQRIINDLLAPYGTALRFEPVISKPYALLPSIRKEGGPVSEAYIGKPARARIHKALEHFSYGKNNESLYESTICSLQINDSRMLANTSEEDLFEKLCAIYNVFSSEIETLLKHNSAQKDFRGKSRMENYTHFLTGLKKEQFKKHGLSSDTIIFPGKFPSKKELLAYFAAHADVKEFTHQTDSKSINGFMKYKADINATEIRVIDAQPTLQGMHQVCESYEQVYEAVSK